MFFAIIGYPLVVMQSPETPALQVFGRYLLIRRLSRGGMGEVYLAKTGQIQGFEKLVVIKRILPNLSNNPDFSKRFVTEADIAIKLSHVNIVPVLEVGKVQDEFFLALEHVEGRDLRGIQNGCANAKRSLPVSLALLIVRDLLNGLSYAHRREDVTGRHLQIVHCDISPPNVLVSYEGEVKVIDFGIAKSVMESENQEEGAAKIGFGKLGYMAPEQILKGHDIDPRTDLYSVGVILWELLTGKKLIVFDESTPYKEIARKVMLEPIPLPSQTVPGIEPALDRLVTVACAKKPEERFQTASEFRDAVQLALVKLAPTTNNETLGTFLRELFAAEIEEERELLRHAKNVDLNPYRHELTSAMEETVSFAVVSEYQDLTSPGRPVSSSFEAELPLSNTARHVLEKASGDELRSIGTSEHPLSHATPSYNGQSLAPSRHWKWAAAGAAAVVGLVMVAWALWPRDPVMNARNLLGYRIQISRMPTPADNPTRDATEVPPAMVEPPVEPVMSMAPDMKVPDAMVAVPPPMTVMQPEMQPEMAPEPPPTDEARENQYKARYARLASKYSEFRQAHGEILAPQWNDLRSHLFGKKNSPDYYPILDQKLNQFEALMKQNGN